MPHDLHFLQLALDEARASAAAGEVPIGAVLVQNVAVLARSGNRTIRDNDPTAHAEIVVLREAARLLGNYRLSGTVLYVTLEPCAMCAGAIVQARVPRLVYAADDPKGGAFRSCFELLTSRERQIYQLLAEGNSNKDIANRLNLSLHTVETHRWRIMEKLDLHSTAELVLSAVRRGTVT